MLPGKQQCDAVRRRKQYSKDEEKCLGCRLRQLHSVKTCGKEAGRHTVSWALDSASAVTASFSCFSRLVCHVIRLFCAFFSCWLNCDTSPLAETTVYRAKVPYTAPIVPNTAPAAFASMLMVAASTSALFLNCCYKRCGRRAAERSPVQSTTWKGHLIVTQRHLSAMIHKLYACASNSGKQAQLLTVLYRLAVQAGCSPSQPTQRFIKLLVWMCAPSHVRRLFHRDASIF